MSKREEIIKGISSLKSIPATGMKAMRLLQDPDSSMAELVQTIAYDPGLTSNILKMANSTYFGCSKAIGSLREAVVRLGSGNIFKLVTASTANVIMNRPIKGYGYGPGEFWEHSIAVAVATETFVDQLQLPGKNIAFTSGLLHDIGKIVLSSFIEKDESGKISEALSCGMSFNQAEAQVFGIDHAELGGILLRSWNLPEELADVVGAHHSPEISEKSPEISALAHISDYICVSNNIGTQDKRPPSEVSQETYQRLNITEEIREECVTRLRDSLETIRDIFSSKS